MRAALIPPIPDLRRVAHDDIHLVLSHLLGDEELTAFYRERSGRGDYVILDNGAHELGVSQTHGELLMRGQSILADEIVLPDVLFDRRGTVERTKVMLKWISKEGWEDYCAAGRPRLMMVPQGKTRTEWVMCLEALLKHWDIYSELTPEPLPDPVIGISKDYDAWQGGLVYLIGYYIEHLLDERNFDLHCLGWPNRLWVVAELARRYPWIRSTDSAKSFVYAKNGILLEPGGVCPRYPRRDPLYFKESLTKVKSPHDSEEKTIWKIAQRNTEVFKAAARNDLILKDDPEWEDEETDTTAEQQEI